MKTKQVKSSKRITDIMMYAQRAAATNMVRGRGFSSSIPIALYHVQGGVSCFRTEWLDPRVLTGEVFNEAVDALVRVLLVRRKQRPLSALILKVRCNVLVERDRLAAILKRVHCEEVVP